MSESQVKLFQLVAVGLFSQITSERTRGEGFNFVRQANYDLVAFIETWWDCPHNWSAAMDGYKLFRRGRQGSRGCGVTLLEIAKVTFHCLSASLVNWRWSRGLEACRCNSHLQEGL